MHKSPIKSPKETPLDTIERIEKEVDNNQSIEKSLDGLNSNYEDRSIESLQRLVLQPAEQQRRGSRWKPIVT